MALECALAPATRIIIPALNTARYVEQGIASAASQDEVSLEVVLVKNGASDRTVEIPRQLVAGAGAGRREPW